MRFDSQAPPPPPSTSGSTGTGAPVGCLRYSPGNILQHVSIVSHVAGPDRRPPSEHDLDIIMTTPNLIAFDGISAADAGAVTGAGVGAGAGAEGEGEGEDAATRELMGAPPAPAPAPAPGISTCTTRFDIPAVPGALLLANVLSGAECDQMAHIAESVGYKPEAIDGIDHIVWLADDAMVGRIFERCRHLLPPMEANGALQGINARFRLFRYFPGSVYRPHIDGAWPGSGIDKRTGQLTDDAFDGSCVSRRTFLIYLNDDFEEGGGDHLLPARLGSGGGGGGVHSCAKCEAHERVCAGLCSP